MFNKITNLKFNEIIFPSWLYRLKVSKWVDWNDMSENEKKYNNCYCCGGYVKKIEYKDAWSYLWSSITDREKKEIESLPNFDAEVFKEITGIQI